MTKADRINAAIDQGLTVQITTAQRVTRVTPKARASWRAAGHEFFKMAADGALLMIEGQTKGKPRYVAILSTVSVTAY